MFSSDLKTIILIFITLIAILCGSRVSQSHDDYQPLIWAVSAMDAIERNEPAPVVKGNNSEQIKSIQLMAAKGEYEPFQIVIRASEGRNLSNVNVFVSDLKNSNGSVINHQNIALYREHYIYVDRPSPQGWPANPTLGKGWYADALIPFVDPETGKDIQGAEIDAVPFNLEAGNSQPIWVDISVPRSTAPGDYQGTYTVESDRGISEGNINLKVWDFELPVQSSINSFFDIWENRGIEAQTLLLRHKLMPSQRLKYDNPKEVVKKLGITSVRLPFWSGANNKTCKMSSAPSVNELINSASQYSQKLLKYVFSADEIDKCSNIKPSLREWAKSIHQAGLKHFVVMTPKPELYDVVDIWGIQPKMYAQGKSEIEEVMEQGDEVWFYTGHQTEYSPQWHIDSAPINHRIPQGWIAQSLGFKGFFLSRTDTWTDDPWQKVPVYSQGKNRDFPGVEMLFYPGDKAGITEVVPSVRLKWIREGVEDYEYIEILKQLGLEDWVLKVIRSVGADWENWTKNPKKLENARIKIGNKIEQISQQ